MNNENSLIAFLYTGDESFSISIKENFSDYSYEDNKEIINFSKDDYFYQLNTFLNSNIFKIEKTFKKFIKNIFLIIDKREFIEIKLSVKKKNYGNVINFENLNLLLKDAISQIKENNRDFLLTHIIIKKYFIDGNYYSSFPKGVKCENLCIDVDFICLSKLFVLNYEKILSEYQIKINKILSANYIRNCFDNENLDIFSMSQKIIEGHNMNEIILVPKKRKNLGFFEKFFNIFS